MQIADRFHLHQNLLDAVKKALNEVIPASINIPHIHETIDPVVENASDKPKKNIDCHSVSLKIRSKKYQLISQIQELLSEGCSQREVARRLGIGRNTVVKYAVGVPKMLLETGFQFGKLDNYIDKILICFDEGCSKSETLNHIQELGYTASKRNAYDYFKKIETILEQPFAPPMVARKKTQTRNNRAGSTGCKYDYITRNGVFQYLWMNSELSQNHVEYIFNEYPLLYEIRKCIQTFRKIYETQNMPLLYLFIDTYKKCAIHSLKTFANGLSKDIDAVENSVASDLSNGFVEGTNNKLKMVKRTMYGRCGLPLIRAKMIVKID